MANAQSVFERAVYLLGAQDEGFIADSSKNRDYKSRTLAILNTLIASLYPRLMGLDARAEGVRPAPPALLASFSEEIPLEAGAADAILPLGLAGHLVLEENPSEAGYLLSRCETETARFARLSPAKAVEIADVYGGLEAGGTL
jgi:hypothetical protein